MIKAEIEYKDGTKETVKKKSYNELAEYLEKMRGKGAIGFEAVSDNGNRIQSREYGGGVMQRADGA